MKKFILLVAGIASLLTAATTSAAERSIAITPAGFVPADVTITVGDVVTWRNTDTRAHQVVVDKAACSVTIQPGAAASCTFRNAGRFTYREPSLRGNAWRGTITVRAAAASVSITAKPLTVTYGAASTLSGVVSNAQPNERVTVSARACGASSFSTAGTVTTGTAGAWSFVVKPLNNTVYQARWRTANSAQQTVKVRPRVSLRKLTGGRFLIRAAAAQSFGGKVASLQRYAPSTRRWVRVRFVVLKVISTGSPTIVSGATTRVRVAPRTRLRVVLGQAQVGACYVAGTSNVVRR